MLRLFLPQATLEEWAFTDAADLREEKLWVAEDRASHPVQPAFHFVQLVSGSDERGLLNKVKTTAQLEALGAEQMMDSVILGDAAYQVVPGYLAELPESALAATAPPAGELAPPVEGAGPPAAQAAPQQSEADLLAAFLLDKL